MENGAGTGSRVRTVSGPKAKAGSLINRDSAAESGMTDPQIAGLRKCTPSRARRLKTPTSSRRYQRNHKCIKNQTQNIGRSQNEKSNGA